MSYVEKSLLPGERVVYAAQLHWIVYLRGLFLTTIGGLIGFYSFHILATLTGINFAEKYNRVLAAMAGVIVLMGIISLAKAYLLQTATELAVTNQRIIAKYGIISRATFEIMINRVTGANFYQTALGRVLGFGTVLVHGAGGDISPIGLIANPQAFHNALMAVIERSR